MSKAKISSEEKIESVETYLGGTGSMNSWSKALGVGQTTFRDWVRTYEDRGKAGLQPRSRNNKYSKELKILAVEAYLSEGFSQREICKRYKITDRKQLREWVKLYNGHRELRPTGGHGSEVYMTKGRKTRYEERIEIVSFCVENSKDYAKTIEHYGISYQQIYAWVRKYEQQGVEGLRDRRGKRKDLSEMTEVERLRAENRLLKAEIKQKELENAVLKKVEELGRRGY